MTQHTAQFHTAESGETDIVLTRDFRHPPARVWRALSEPDLVQAWLGTTSFTSEDRVEGAYRYDFPDFSFTGTYLAYDPPHRMEQDERFSLDEDYRAITITDLTPQGPGTRMTVTLRYPDAKARAAAVVAGFTSGHAELYDRLDALAL